MSQSNIEKENMKPILNELGVQERLKTAQLAGFGQNEGTCEKEQEEESSLLRSQEAKASNDRVEVKIQDSNKEGVKDIEEEHNGSLKVFMLTQTETTKLTKSNLAKSMVAEQQMADLELHDLKLNNLMLADSKQANSEVIDSKLADSMLNDVNLIKLMTETPKLATSEILNSQPSSKDPGFQIKQSRKRRKLECCSFLRPSDKYSFLLELDFLLLSIFFLFLSFGCNVPFVYMVPYSLSMDISHHQAVLLMSILGVMGIVGNITFGWISDRK